MKMLSRRPPHVGPYGKGLIAVILFALLLPATLRGAEPVDAVLERAHAARAEGMPQMVIYDLRRALRLNPEASRLGELRLLLARCLIESGRATEAVALLREAKGDHGREESRPSQEERFWLAQALAESEHFEEARGIYAELGGAEDFALRAAAIFGEARMARVLGHADEALAGFRKVPKDSPYANQSRLAEAAILIEKSRLSEARAALDAISHPDRGELEQKAYLAGVLQLKEGDADGALKRFSELEAGSAKVAAGAAAGKAEAQMQLGHEDTAAETIENFIRANPHTPALAELMRTLDEIYAGSDDPSNAELKRWRDEYPELAALATYYFARDDERQGRLDRAKKSYQEFLDRNPRHRLQAKATIELARLLLVEGRFAEAELLIEKSENVPAGPAERSRLRFLRGVAQYRAENYRHAAAQFSSAAEADRAIAGEALFNRALAELKAGQPLQSGFAELKREFSDLAAGIELADVFASAENGMPGSEEALRKLSTEARDAGVRARARFALAEWEWLHGDVARARGDYRRVANDPAISEEREGYFAAYLADDGSMEAIPAVIRAAQRYLEENPDSPHEAEVRMKWGEVLTRQGNHRAARVQFESAGRETADPEARANALFLAARSAAASMEPELIEEAIAVLLEEVAQQGGPLAVQARLEQGLLQNALGRPEEAITLFNRIIESSADPRLRVAAQLKKGDTLFSMGETDRERLKQAIGVWERVAARPEATIADRNEALTKAAAAYEKLGNTDAALSVYYQVLNAAREGEPEYYWFYRSGFDAARLLEKRERFPEAVAVYEKVAAVNGPRTKEATEEVKRLRLENFIWDK